MTRDVIDGLKEAIGGYDPTGARAWAVKAVEARIDPVVAFSAMTDVMKEIGDRFEAGECWLPELIGAAGAMQAAVPVLEEEIRNSGGHLERLGTVVTGSVRGDIHSIGIEMVGTLLMVEGFDVRYLGIDVAAEVFADAVEETGADIVAMSALLTVTAAEQKKVIDLLVARHLRNQVKVMVGGGAITEDFAVQIGADGYGASALGAVELARSWVVPHE